MDQVPEVRDRNRRVRQMERSRRNRSRKDQRPQGKRDDGRREREKKKDVSTLDRPENHTKNPFIPPSETKAEVRNKVQNKRIFQRLFHS